MATSGRALILSAMLVTAALAGCLGLGGGDDGGQQADPQGLDTQTNETEGNETETEDRGPVLTKTWHNGSIEGGSLPTGGYYCSPAGPCENSLEFEVAGEPQTILVEAAWEGDADAWLNVTGPECESALVVLEFCSPAASSDGSSPLAVQFDDERTNATGTWTGELWVDASTPTQIDATIVATVVEEGQLPRGYTALEAASSGQGA
jgi:hypothetical protein